MTLMSQKLLRVALRTVFLVSPSLLVVNQSPRLYFWLQKSSTTRLSTISAEFKVQSEQHMCIYVHSIRNYGILIYCCMYAYAQNSIPPP